MPEVPDTEKFLDWKDREPMSKNPPLSQDNDLALVGKTLGIDFYTDLDMNDGETFITVLRKGQQEARPIILTRNGPLLRGHAIPFTSAKSPSEAEQKMAELIFTYAISVNTAFQFFPMPYHTSKDELLLKLSIIGNATWTTLERQARFKKP